MIPVAAIAQAAPAVLDKVKDTLPKETTQKVFGALGQFFGGNVAGKGGGTVETKSDGGGGASDALDLISKIKPKAEATESAAPAALPESINQNPNAWAYSDKNLKENIQPSYTHMRALVSKMRGQ